jgi:hypothetical protein
MPLQVSQKNAVTESSTTTARRLLFAPTLFFGAALLLPLTFSYSAAAQAPAATAPSPNAPQRGTVKAISGSVLTIASDTGKTITVNLTDGAKVTQLAPGSTDLKTGTAAAVTDIAVGDRILVAVKAGDAPDTYTSARVVLMKSGDIADRQAAQKADWQRRGSGGLVSAVDASGTITVSSGAKKVVVSTTPTTIYRRYAADSIKFEDAVVGTLSQIQPGDQLRMRGAKSEDGTTEVAEEIVSGSFSNISATISSIDAASSTVTVKDLASKKTVVVKVTPNSEIKALPAMMATRLAAANNPGGAPPAAGAAGGGAARPAGAEAPAGDRPQGGGGYGGGQGRAGGGMGGPGGGRGGDLSSIVARLPAGSLSTLKAGDALMIVGTSTPGSTGITAITVLSGVEPLLTKTGAPAMQLAPWSMGGSPGEGGGGGGQ